MADIYFLAGRARGKLVQQASSKDPDIRRILGHARLLDSLVMELSARQSTWSEKDAQEEDNHVDAGPEGGRCYPELEDSDDSDSDSSDSDSGSEWHSYEDFEQEGPGDWYEETCDDSADAESKASDLAPMEFYQWEMAKPPIQVHVHEARDEIES